MTDTEVKRTEPNVEVGIDEILAHIMKIEPVNRQQYIQLLLALCCQLQQILVRLEIYDYRLSRIMSQANDHVDRSLN